jgi:hypothetical protein
MDERVNGVLALLSESTLMHLEEVRRPLKNVSVVSSKIARDRRAIHMISGPLTRDATLPQVFVKLYGEVFKDVAARTISTYPMGRCGKVRDGSPICDSYLARFQGNSVIVCLADGCGWGARSREASVKAKSGFVEYMDQKLGKCLFANDVSRILLRAVAAAHCRIIEGKSEESSVGTTTLLGGYVVPLKDACGCVFVFFSVGDCKAYSRSSNGKIIDLACNVRASSLNAADPGGRNWSPS